ncbi:MAG: hypothetical protein KatS3mg029_0942 [Saprospiraceae bacterium]|nr:MAG: hypothetical protein KatS3mg029_0942 [Saprospiraceae bacterium]
MFKRDWVTISIIALCVIAIGFLIYRLTKSKPQEPVTPAVQEEPMPDTTYYENDITTYEADTVGSSSNRPGGSETSSSSVTTQPPVETRESTISSVGGRYLVLAGAYRQMANAERALRDLKAKGYQNARIELFDRGTYAVILVDRFDDLAQARQLQSKLKKEGIDCYVKLKQ